MSTKAFILFVILTLKAIKGLQCPERVFQVKEKKCKAIQIHPKYLISRASCLCGKLLMCSSVTLGDQNFGSFDQISKIWIHEKFQNDVNPQMHDVALIRIKQPIFNATLLCDSFVTDFLWIWSKIDENEPKRRKKRDIRMRKRAKVIVGRRARARLGHRHYDYNYDFVPHGDAVRRDDQFKRTKRGDKKVNLYKKTGGKAGLFKSNVSIRVAHKRDGAKWKEINPKKQGISRARNEVNYKSFQYVHKGKSGDQKWKQSLPKQQGKTKGEANYKSFQYVHKDKSGDGTWNHSQPNKQGIRRTKRVTNYKPFQYVYKGKSGDHKWKQSQPKQEGKTKREANYKSLQYDRSDDDKRKQNKPKSQEIKKSKNPGSEAKFSPQPANKGNTDANKWIKKPIRSYARCPSFCSDLTDEAAIPIECQQCHPNGKESKAWHFSRAVPNHQFYAIPLSPAARILNVHVYSYGKCPEKAKPISLKPRSRDWSTSSPKRWQMRKKLIKVMDKITKQVKKEVKAEFDSEKATEELAKAEARANLTPSGNQAEKEKANNLLHEKRIRAKAAKRKFIDQSNRRLTLQSKAANEISGRSENHVLIKNRLGKTREFSNLKSEEEPSSSNEHVPEVLNRRWKMKKTKLNWPKLKSHKQRGKIHIMHSTKNKMKNKPVKDVKNVRKKAKKRTKVKVQ